MTGAAPVCECTEDSSCKVYVPCSPLYCSIHGQESGIPLRALQAADQSEMNVYLPLQLPIPDRSNSI
jgi:hypothetical protein